MAGKPTISKQVLRRIRTLAKKGHGRRAIGCSLYTVRKTLDPDFAERERARHRRAGPARYAARKDDPAYIAYQAEANASDAHRSRARASMARLRRQRREAASLADPRAEA